MSKLFKYITDKYDKLDDDEKARWTEGVKAPRPVKAFKMPAEIEIKPSVDGKEHIAIAVSLMLAKDMLKAAVWVKGGLDEAIRDRERAEIDQVGTDCILSYHGDGMIREWASKNPEMKLLCRLVGLISQEDDDHNWKWTVPAELRHEQLQMAVSSIESALDTPFQSLDGEPITSLVQRKRKDGEERRKQLTKVVNEYGDEEEIFVPRRQRGARSQNSRPFIEQDLIEDSDEEIEIAERILAERNASLQIGKKRDADASSDLISSDDEDDDRSQVSRPAKGSSERRSRSSSVTSSSVHDVISPTARKRKMGIASRGAALFLGSDEEDKDDDADDESHHHGAVRRSSALEKRALYESDNEQNDDLTAVALDTSTVVQAPSPTHTQARKRRALIIDDEDDE